ncbi:MAG TPA: DUF1624 domain-containing protein [Firmicutes bacterium]|jgi:hypothetical protein|nr:DUF1624 domain-containing protein [Bacillota bacterium]
MEYLRKVRSKRFKEIDALRGLAVLIMVFSHALRWVYAGNPVDIIGLFGDHTPGDIATPMFYLAAGLSLYYSMQSRFIRNADPTSIWKDYSVRMGKLFLIGVAMSFTWGVLQAQAISLFLLMWLILSAARICNFNRLRSFFPGILVLVLTLHLLLSECSLPFFWEKLLAGKFPLFAIMFINAAGFYYAPYLRSHSFSTDCTVLGAGSIAAALLLAENGTAIERYGASITFLLLGVGLSVFLLGIFHSRLFQKTFFFRCFTLVGKDALFLFVFHYAAFFLPLYFLGLQEKMSPAGALIFSIAVVVAVIITAVLRRNSNITVYNLLDMIFISIWSTVLSPMLRSSDSLTRRQIACPEEAGARLDR